MYAHAMVCTCGPHRLSSPCQVYYQLISELMCFRLACAGIEVKTGRFVASFIRCNCLCAAAMPFEWSVRRASAYKVVQQRVQAKTVFHRPIAVAV